MSNLKKIGNKLFKETTELKSHSGVELSMQIELSVADGVKQIKSDAKNKVNAASNDIASAIKKFDSFLGKIKQAEKDLGIDLSKEYSDIEKTDTKARQLLKKAESLISDLASI